MSEEFNPVNESKDARSHACARGEDLVAYLYKEASPQEARSFEQHARSCAACRDELAAFGAVRESVGAWRADALSITPTLALDSSVARVPQGARKRSALAAMREFFALSPAWLRIGAPAAVALACALTVLTLARAEVRWNADGFAFRTGGASAGRVSTQAVEVAPATAPDTAPATFTRQQVEEMIRAETLRARAELRAELSADAGDSRPVVITADDRRTDAGGRARSNSDARPRARRAGGTKQSNATRRQEQARAGDEDGATSLYDLLRVVN